MEIDLGRVLDALPAMVWTALPDGHIDFVNRRWSEYTGLSLDEAHGWEWQAAINPDDLPKLLERWRSILTSGQPGEMDARLRRSDGQYRRFLVQCSPICNDAGRIVQWCGVGTDVEDFRRAEDALRRRDLDFQLIVDSIPVPVAVTTPLGEVEGLNQPTLDYFGKTSEELKGWKASEVVHPDDIEQTVAAQLEAHQKGSAYNVESRHRRADGIYRWYNVRGFPLRDPDGNILRWFHLLIDIDDRKHVEEALRQREAQLAEAERDLRLTIDTIPVLVAAYQPDGTRSFVNRTWQDYMGLTPEEATSADATTFPHFHPADVDRNDEAWRASLASGEPLSIEVRLRRADGQYRWHKSLRVPFRDANGKIVRWYSVGIDIDDQKRAEEALRESEREARLIVNSIPAGIEVLTPTGKVEAVNSPIIKYFGKAEEELRRRGMADFIHPDDLQNVLDTALHSTTTGAPYDAEQRFRGADGTYRWFQVRGLPLRDANGRIVRWYALHIDIDDRKRAEEALFASERNLNEIINTIPALAWSARPDGTAEFFNQLYLNYMGLSAEQAQGWGWTAAVHPDDLTGLAATWQAILASRMPGEAEARLLRRDGDYRWFLFRTNPLRDESGNIVKWYGVNTDIEDRKQAEAELKRAYDSFADAQRLSKTGSFITDLLADDHNWSEEAFRIFEFDPGTKITVQRVREVVHPEDLPSFDSVIERGSTGIDVNFEFRIVTARGTMKHVRGLAHVVEQVAGRPMFIGALQDVTETKVAEEGLNKARSELAHVARVTTLSVLTASIAHEVNQPLSGIITNAGTCLRLLAADPPNVEGARETARRTIRDGNRAADVITRLRALFSKRATTIEPVDLNEAAREVIALSWGDLQRSRMVVRTELAEELPLVGGNRVQLQQVVMNLLRNASDAMSGIDDRPRRLVLRTEPDEDHHVCLSVQDAGVGFGPEAAERLFEAFYTTKSDGTGIGLSISRSIIESHHGRLWAEANDGPGATFAFSIPAYSGDEASARDTAAAHVSVTGIGQSAAGAS